MTVPGGPGRVREPLGTWASDCLEPGLGGRGLHWQPQRLFEEMEKLVSAASVLQRGSQAVRMHSVPRAAATASAAQSLLGRKEEKGERVQVLDQAAEAMMDGGGRRKGSARTASSVEASLPLRRCVGPGSPNVGNVEWRALRLTLCSAL